jgi:hypothetical protein
LKRQEAESALGICFPPSYRAFLQAFGAGSIRGREIYGILDGDYQNSAIPDGIWLTLQERQSSGLPESLVIVRRPATESMSPLTQVSAEPMERSYGSLVAGIVSR